MGSCRVSIKPSASKELGALPTLKDRLRATSIIRGLSANPRLQSSPKLAGVSDVLPIRFGSYRILDTVCDRGRFVAIVKIARRREAYQRVSGAAQPRRAVGSARSPRTPDVRQQQATFRERIRMPRSAAPFVLTAALLAAAAQAAEPCSPRPMLPQHIPAFVSPSPPVSDTSAVQPLPSSARASELGIQTDCLRWEASLSPRAHFIGTVSIGSPAASGPASSVPEGRTVVLPMLLESRASRFPAGILPDLSLQPAEDSRSFSLGALLPPTP